MGSAGDPAARAPGGAAGLPPPCPGSLSLLLPGLLTLAPSFLDFMGPLDTWAAPLAAGLQSSQSPHCCLRGKKGLQGAQGHAVPSLTSSFSTSESLGTSSRSEGRPPTKVNVCPLSIGPGGGAGTGSSWARWCFSSRLPVWSAGWPACAPVLGRVIKITID